MSLIGKIKKINRKFNLVEKKEYSLNLKKNHHIKGSLFSYAMKYKEASLLKVSSNKKGVNVCLKFKHDEKSRVVYYFKYNKDNLLLLRGVSVNKKMVISDSSILDFAISAKPFGENCSFEWVPAHQRKKMVSVDNTISIDYDDTHFKINQTFNAVNPNFPSEVLWKHNIIHEISAEKPFLEVTNNINFVRDTEIKRTYLTMLAVNSKAIDRFLSSDGALFDEIPNDGTKPQLDNYCSSAMCIGDSGDGIKYAAAVESDQNKRRQAFVTFRQDNLTKFYIDEFSGIARKNESIEGKQRITCVPGIEL